MPPACGPVHAIGRCGSASCCRLVHLSPLLVQSSTISIELTAAVHRTLEAVLSKRGAQHVGVVWPTTPFNKGCRGVDGGTSQGNSCKRRDSMFKGHLTRNTRGSLIEFDREMPMMTDAVGGGWVFQIASMECDFVPSQNEIAFSGRLNRVTSSTASGHLAPLIGLGFVALSKEKGLEERNLGTSGNGGT